MQIIGTGLNGLVGSRIVEVLSRKHEFENLGRSEDVDITEKNSLENAKKSKASVFIHLAAKTDVDSCEEDRELGEEGEAFKVNVLGTQNIAEFCRETGKKLIYISTDFVFDGKKPAGEFYFEEDLPNPINWYGETKYLGEEIVRRSGVPYAILRIAYPYRKSFSEKKDFFRAILENLKEGKSIKAVKDQMFAPTFVDDMANSLDKVLEQNSEGIFHIVGSDPITPYMTALKIAEVFGLNKSLISETTREEYFRDKAQRPFNLALRNDKIEQMGAKMKNFEEGLRQIKSQKAS